jgi:hypothetical protein
MLHGKPPVTWTVNVFATIARRNAIVSLVLAIAKRNAGILLQ